MVNSINPNQINYGYAQQQNGNQQPFNANVHRPENDMLTTKMDSAKKSPLTSIGLFLGSWFGLSKLADRFNYLTRKEYSQSLPGKIGQFGDKIGNSSISRGIAKFFEPMNKGLKNYWAKNNEKSTFLRWLKNPAEREWKWAKAGASYGYVDEVAMDALDVLRGFRNKHGEGTFQKVFGNKYEYFDAMNGSAHKHAKEIEQALKKGMDYCKKNNIDDVFMLDDIPMIKTKARLPKILGRKTSLVESYNKMQVVKGLKNPMQKTALGKLLPKWTFKTIEGATNGTAGGKIAIMMQAGMLADAIYRTYKAPKGEKVSTFMECMTNDIAMYMMIPLYSQFFNRVGGLKYLGMTTAQKNAYQSTLNAFNEAAKTGALNKNAHKIGKKAIKELRGAGSKWYLKPFRAIGRIMDYGTERIYPYLKTGKNVSILSKTGNFFKRLGHGLKGSAGIARMLFAFTFLAPLLAKPVVKVSHLIFGKPTNSVLDEGKEETKKASQNAANHQAQIAQLFAPTKADGTNALGLNQAEMQALKAQNLSNEEILQVALYKKKYEEQTKRQEELANAKPLPSNNLLKKPLNSAKGVTQASSTYRNYIPNSNSKIKPPEIPAHIIKAFANADACAQDATDVLK